MPLPVRNCGSPTDPVDRSRDDRLVDPTINNGLPSPEAISTYEELFDDGGGKERPCYLPDETQEHQSASFNSRSMLDAEGEFKRSHPSQESRSTLTEGNSSSNGAHVSPEQKEHDPTAVCLHIRGENTENGTAQSSQEISDEDQDIVVDSSQVVIAERYSEASLSPSSSDGRTSGYVAGSGSNSAISLCSINGIEAIRDLAHQDPGENDERNGNRVDWVPGKRHPDEDDTNMSWRKHKKHFFILSHSGKPIFSRYGDEHKLAGFSATLQAIMSFVENSGDRIKYIRAGDHQIIFLVKGPIYLVSISATEEPLHALRGQLELLYGQLLLILTKSVEKCFIRNAKFDMKPLLGGTEVVFSSLIHAFSWNFATFLHAYTCLPLPYATRQAAGAALQDVADHDILFAFLLCGSKVVSLSGARKASLHPDDVLLLSNFVTSSVSFRTTESFSPVCLPRYNAAVFVYAYVQYLDAATSLILLTTNPDGFFHLKDCRAHIEVTLAASNVLREVENSVQKGGLKVEDLPSDSTLASVARGNTHQSVMEPAGSTRHRVVGVGGVSGLWHFLYRSIYLDQYVASEYSPPLHTHGNQKRLFRAYQRLHASMHNGPIGAHRMHYRRDENYVLLSWNTQDFELFAAFDPLAEKSSAITVCNQICKWLRDLESEIFLLGQSPFSW